LKELYTRPSGVAEDCDEKLATGAEFGERLKSGDSAIREVALEPVRGNDTG